MTTIVWDGKTVAWDSQVTSGEVKYVGDKCAVLSDGKLMLLAGDISLLRACASLYDSGEGPVTFPNGDYTLLLVGSSGASMYESGGDAWEPLDGPMCLGSGRMAAYAALHLGNGSRAACEVACHVDLYSSGPVNVWPKRKVRTKI